MLKAIFLVVLFGSISLFGPAIKGYYRNRQREMDRNILFPQVRDGTKDRGVRTSIIYMHMKSDLAWCEEFSDSTLWDMAVEEAYKK